MLGNKLTIANLIYRDNCVGYRLFCVTKGLENSIDVYDVSKEIGDMYDLFSLSDRDILLIPDGKLLISRDEIDNAYIVKDISDDTSILDTILNTGYNKGNLIENMGANEEDTEDEVIDFSEEDAEDEVTEDEVTDFSEEDIEYEDDEDTEDTDTDFNDDIDNNFIDEEDDIEEDELYGSTEEDEFIDTIDDIDNNFIDEEDDIEEDELYGSTEEDEFIDTIDDMYYDEDDEDEDIDSEENAIKNCIVDYLCGLYLKPARLVKFKEAKGIPVNLDIEIGNELRKVTSNLSIKDVTIGIIDRMKKEGYVYKNIDEFYNGMTEGTFMEIV